ncbi:MAG: hypothetical protein M3Z35_02785 [Nitrospirota bacterium]|nr:hypothetical protein [Nitrospirota bacterium]
MKHRYTIIVQKSERGIYKTMREQYPGPHSKLVDVLLDFPNGWIGVVKTHDSSGVSTIHSENSPITRGGGAKPPPLNLRALRDKK